MMPVSRRIKARIDYSKESHPDFAQFLDSIYKNLLGNRFFSNPPIALAVFRAKLDEYNELIVAAMDNSRTAISKRNSVREELAKMATQLVHYVEAASDEDPAIFDTSGCERIPTHR